MENIEPLTKTYTVVFTDNSTIFVSGVAMCLEEGYMYYIYKDKKMEKPAFISTTENVKYILESWQIIENMI